MLTKVILAGTLASVCAPSADAQSTRKSIRVDVVATVRCEECSAETPKVDVNPAGDFVLVVDAAPVVRQFDKAGRGLASWGRKGEGPGELQSPIRVMLERDREVIVVDAGAARVTWFTKTGAATATRATRGMPLTAIRDERGTLHLLLMTDAGPVLQRTRADSGLGAVAPPLLAPGSAADLLWRSAASVAVLPGGRIVYANGLRTYRILARSPGRAADTTFAERSGPAPQMDDEEYAAFSERMRQVMAKVAARMKTTPPPARPIPRDKPFIQQDGLRVDGRGRLWVLSGRSNSQQSTFDIFGADGAFLQEVVIPQAVRSFSLARKWLVTAGPDSEGVIRASLWEVHD